MLAVTIGCLDEVLGEIDFVYAINAVYRPIITESAIETLTGRAILVRANLA